MKSIIFSLMLIYFISLPSFGRGEEVLYSGCKSNKRLEDITVFDDGTVAYKKKIEEATEVKLGYLTLEDVKNITTKVLKLLKSVKRYTENKIDGENLVKCELRLSYNKKKYRFTYLQLDTIDPALATAVAVVWQLKNLTSFSLSSLPYKYKPKIGDLLLSKDGKKFKVVGYTSDGKGIELENVDSPLVIYLPIEEVKEYFVKLLNKQDVYNSGKPKRF